MSSVQELRALLTSRLPEVDSALEEYQDEGPEEEQSDREKVVQRALTYLNDQTFGRITEELEDDILRCCGEALLGLVDVLESYRGMEGKKGLNAETVGGWSRSYTAAADWQKSREQELRSALWRTLGGTGLLYRGWD